MPNAPTRALAGIAAAALTLIAGPTADADQARYRVTFDADWSRTTHPTGFPSNPHFSGLVGATHHHGVDFWTRGELASPGIESMAETGSKTRLLQEVGNAVRDGTARASLSGPGIGRSPGTAAITLTADSRYPLLTLVSMIAPSPDWFVGTDALNLFENGDWQDNLVITLLPYDAGTDSGSNYTSGNSATNPPQPISRLCGTAPFVRTPPIGTFTVELIPGQSLCPLDLDSDGRVAISDLLLYLDDFLSNDPRAERTGDGQLSIVDLTDLLAGYFANAGPCTRQ